MSADGEGWGISDVLTVLGVVAFIVIGYWLFPEDDGFDDGPPRNVCAGIGLEGPQAASPEAAFDHWLALQAAEPVRDAWQMSPPQDDPVSKTSHIAFTTEVSPRWWSVSVASGPHGEVAAAGVDGSAPPGEPLGPDDWHVSGGCVRMPEP